MFCIQVLCVSYFIDLPLLQLLFLTKSVLFFGILSGDVDFCNRSHYLLPQSCCTQLLSYTDCVFV